MKPGATRPGVVRPGVVRPGADHGGLATVPGARFAELPVTAIEPNAKQPRDVLDEEALEKLKTSIQEVGGEVGAVGPAR
jgi:ParB family chromosome partitioning protein